MIFRLPPAFSQVVVPEFTVQDSITKIIEGRIYKAVEAPNLAQLESRAVWKEVKR